jgi:hypothetical protein
MNDYTHERMMVAPHHVKVALHSEDSAKEKKNIRIT